MPRDAVQLSLRVAATEAQRQAAIEAWLRRPDGGPSRQRVIIAEGILFDRQGPQGVPVIALAGGCPCCIGAVALRVTLARTLRRHAGAAVLLLVLADEHGRRLRRQLASGELGLALEVD
jgi:hypothetical protein